MTAATPIIPFLESQTLVSPTTVVPEASLPISLLGRTYTMAQEVRWIAADHFAVGRWDGTLSIFNQESASTTGPIISFAVSSPSYAGIQMITWVSQNVFISSNDNQSLVVWQAIDGDFHNATQQIVPYDSRFDVANSGYSVAFGDVRWFICGHASGFLTIWQIDQHGQHLKFQRAVDLSVSNPVNPWKLQNIRGVVNCFTLDGSSAYVVAGSENGYLFVVRVIDGKIMSKTLYNPKARRGINSISSFGSNLLVANCSVGPSDKNLWYYRINPNNYSIQLQDSTNLIINTNLEQVFNFSVTWGAYGNPRQICFFSATQEGVMWMGTIQASKINVLGNTEVASAQIGAAIAYNFTEGLVSVAGYDVSTYNTAPAKTDRSFQNPEMISESDIAL